MHDDLNELFNVVDRLRNKVGTSRPLPVAEGTYLLVDTDEGVHNIRARLDPYLGGPSWFLGGQPISQEGLRRYLKTYNLRLVHIPRGE